MNIRLKDFRDANGLRQDVVAEVLEISQSAISRMEALGRDLSQTQIEKLCEKYGEAEVMKFAGVPNVPVVNPPVKEEYSLPEAFAILSETVKTQARTIEVQAMTIQTMQKRIDDQLEQILYLKQQMQG